MKSFLFFILVMLTCLHCEMVSAQTATFSLPVSIGRNNCGSGVDSLYYYNYSSPNLSNSSSPTGCLPSLTPRGFSINAAGIAFNPADGLFYYQLVDFYSNPWKTYIWRWSPYACPSTPLDTLRTFNSGVIGITFDASGKAWQMDFSPSINPLTGSLDAYLSSVDFNTGVLGQKDTMDLTGGAKLYTANSGDITMTPSGQMYYVVDNKLFTPDYKSYGSPSHHITCTYIDTVKKPAGASDLVGLAYADGDLLSSYSVGCLYSKLDPITGDSANVTYTFPGSKGIYAVDMTQINSGIGAAKQLVSVTPTGTPKQYDVVYDVYVQNYGNVPLTNVQLTDDLTSVNGAANLSNVTATLISNAAGVTLDPTYNGNSNLNLLAAGQSVPNFPVANNNFTVRISCTLSNILPGIIYNNSAIATGNGFNNIALRDSSTNGPTPDLNQNDKPDDVGEGQPTPFLIAITPFTPPCAAINSVLYSEDFGSGTGLSSTFPGSGTSTYTGTNAAPVGINKFTITDNAQNGDASNWINLTDHTGGVNGRMMLINADATAGVIYSGTLPIICPGQQYSFSFWASFIGNASYQTLCNGFGGFKYPKLLIRVRDQFTGLVITQYTTADITSTSWGFLGIKWVMPSGYSNIIFEIINAGPGGCGNDLAIDDIRFGLCDPLPTAVVNPITAGCIGSATVFSGNLSDTLVVPGAKDYQWQISTNNTTWSDIAGATSGTYTINPVTNSDAGKYYRLIVAAQGNIATASCRYTSPGLLLTAKSSSVAPTSINRSQAATCPGYPVDLTVVGGSLGTNATWKWYTGGCGNTYIGTGTTITVTPSVTTNYYVRAEGDCNNTVCQSVTVFVACNVLSAGAIDFKGLYKSSSEVQLNWHVILPGDVERFEIYRSTDNQSYKLAGTVPVLIQSKELQTFSITDDIRSVMSNAIYYRLYVIGKNGEQTASNVIAVKPNHIRSFVTLMPNPATENTTVKIQSEKEGDAVIKMIDNTGRIIFIKREKLVKGDNFIKLNNLPRFGGGIYNVQVLLNDEIINSKLAIIK
ncbi:MAG: T9SS type A sorting domain-containing protein [Bacteroidota bacterium]|nr:T9SS type A sorting domain-containing protein [Bacteroidota bacterium]